MFKVSITDPNSHKTQSHTLQANDEHDKRQWMTCIRSVLPETPAPHDAIDCQSLFGGSDGEDTISINDENAVP